MKKRSIYVANQPLDEAREVWHEELSAIGFYSRKNIESIHVDKGLDRRTANPVFAAHSSPSYNAAAMDGIAVRFHDLDAASEASPVILEPGRFQPVNTGNAVEEPFNGVVMIEDVQYLENGSVELVNPATPWQHVRSVGEDIVATELIIPEGHRIRPIDQGAMLASGVTEIDVLARPSVTVVPTGSDLISPGEPGKPGDIIEFNSRILCGDLSSWGADARAHAPVPDDPAALREAISAAVLTSDIVVTNAGASVGTKDFSTQVLGELGRVVVHGVAIKPGKPVILAIVGNTPVIGLPGYPVSAVLTMRLFLKDMIHSFLGLEPPAPVTVQAVTSRPMHSPMGVDQFVRVTLGSVGDTLIATPSGKGAGSVMSMVRADGLLTIPARSEGVGAGEHVTIELLRSRSEISSTLISIGSHDNILDVLANQLHRLKAPIRLSSAHVGSMGGIMAIKRGEAHIAGSHLLDEDTGEYNVSFIKRFLGGIPLKLVNLCYREQGLIVASGNPKKIQNFNDISENGHLFINRQKGAGTRLLTDQILRESGLDPEQIPGYDHEEYTHMNVAAAVASGSVDTGMGIRAAALALGLDFVPVAEERYDLIIPEQFITDHRILAALDIIREHKDFRENVLALGGYDLRDSGDVQYSQ
jgi:putative molybdopterin biosynthesis protein